MLLRTTFLVLAERLISASGGRLVDMLLLPKVAGMLALTAAPAAAAAGGSDSDDSLVCEEVDLTPEELALMRKQHQ